MCWWCHQEVQFIFQFVDFFPLQEVGTCLRTTQSPEPVHFTFRNCSSVQAFRPRFCGRCSDGRCCTPHATKTAPVTFRCPDGSTLKRPVMFIRTCACHRNCPAKDNVPQRGPETDHASVLTHWSHVENKHGDAFTALTEPNSGRSDEMTWVGFHIKAPTKQLINKNDKPFKIMWRNRHRSWLTYFLLIQELFGLEVCVKLAAWISSLTV